MRKILIRFDDLCPFMDKQEWNKAIEVLDKYNVKPLIGVIPDCKDDNLRRKPEDPEFWEYIHSLQNKGYVVAMHGFQHVYDNKKRGKVNNGFSSEFAGHPYDVQYERIRLGKKVLSDKGVITDVFFAPSHSYDDNTIKALRANGFKYMDDGKSAKPIDDDGIILVPCRCGGVPKIKKDGYFTAVFHCDDWLKPEKQENYYKLVELCEKYWKDTVDFYEYCERKPGNTFFQKINEWLYVRWERYLSHYYYSLKKTIKHMISSR